MDKATSSTTNFTLCEEAFLLSSLSEVVKVWARGSGQASFALKIDNGEADLQLSFKLGHPTDAHIQPLQAVFQPPYQDQDQENTPDRKKKVRKTPSCRRRNRVRAAQHQARL